MRRPAAEEEDDGKGQQRDDEEIAGYRLPEHVRPHLSHDQRLEQPRSRFALRPERDVLFGEGAAS